MKQSKWRSMRQTYRGIHLVDRCLLIFMAFLLLQAAYSLFAPSGGAELEHIDVIMRTSTAGIFGYFLSANFIRHERSTQHTTTARGPVVERAEPLAGDAPKNQIGFSAVPPTAPGGAETVPAAPAVVGRLQILVAAGIGLFALILLTFVRNWGAWQEVVESSTSAIATVAQLRDLVSGCVGFLIGSPTGHD